MLKAFLKTIETFRLRGELACLVSRKISWEKLHVWKDVKCYTNMSSYQLFRISVPVAQWLEHCVSSAKVVGSIPREHMY